MDWERARQRERTPTNRASRRAQALQKPVNPRASAYPPSPEQIAYLRALSQQAGIRYTAPRTSRQASARIKALLRKQPRT